MTVYVLFMYPSESLKVKFSGGREVKGILKGHDTVANLVLDEVQDPS